MQRLVIKFSAKFGNSEEITDIIKSTIKTHLEGKDQVSPESFDAIEADIASKLGVFMENHTIRKDLSSPQHMKVQPSI